MPQRLVHTAGSPIALEARLLALLAPLREADPLHPIVVWVASNTVRARLRRVLCRDASVRAGVRLWTARDLARHLAERPFRAAGLAPLQSPADLLLLEERIAPLAAADGPFGAGAGTPGFARALAETFKDLAESGCDPERLPEDTANLAEVRRLYGEWRRAVRACHAYTPDEVLAAAADADPVLPDGADRLFVFGLYDLTGLQRRLLAHLANHVHVDVCIPVLEAEEANAYGQPLHTWLAQQGFRVMAQPAPPAPTTDLAHLQRTCFGRGGVASPARGADGTVRVASVPGGIREIREVARTLCAWRREGVAWADMAVLYHGAGDTGALIREVLAGIRVPLAGEDLEARLPVRTPEDPTLAETVAGRAVVALCGLRDSLWRRADVIETLGMAPLRSLDGPAPTARWEAAARDAGVVARRAQWDTRLRALAERHDRDATRTADDGDEDRRGRALESRAAEARACRTAVLELADACAAIPDASDPTTLAEALIACAERLWVDDPQRTPGFDAVRGAIRALGAVRQVTASLTWDRFRRLVVETLRTTRSGLARPAADGVFIGSLYGARGLTFQRVAIVRLTERQFPPPVREDPLLPDTDRTRIRAALPDCPIPRAEDRPAEDRMLFALTLAAAAEQVWLSVPRVDPGSGRELVPSLFALRAIEAITGTVVRGLEPDDPALRDLCVHVALAPLAPDARGLALDTAEFDLSVTHAAAAEGDGALLAGLAEEGSPLARALTAAAHRLGARTLTPWDGVLADPANLDALAAASLAEAARSPSRLETFARCPYQFFLRYLCGLEAVEEPDEASQMLATDRGSLVHAVLEDLVRAFRDRLPLDDATLPGALARADTLLDEWFAQYAAEGRAGAPVVADADRERIRPHVRAYVARELTRADWVPVATELAFGLPPRQPGDPHGDDPVAVTLPDGTVLRFRGYVDRVDRSADGTAWRVVDYKTGRKLPDPDRVANGEALQLPVYALAAQAALDGGPTTAAEYHPVGPGTRKTPATLAGPALDDAQRALIDVAVTVDAHVRQGRFPFHPAENACRVCDFQGVCGPGRDAIWERKAHDPAAADYLAMRQPRAGRDEDDA